MQIKKEEVMLSIKESAIKEFLLYGFEKASLRRITKNAGTTLGNFYNYFDNKESLLSSIVEETYQIIQLVIKTHNQNNNTQEIWNEADINIWRIELKKMIQDYLPIMTPALVILIEGCRGTKYENAKDVLIKIVSEHYMEHIKECNDNYLNPEISSILAKQFIMGIVQIIKEYKDLKIVERLIVEYIIFYVIGSFKIIEK